MRDRARKSTAAGHPLPAARIVSALAAVGILASWLAPPALAQQRLAVAREGAPLFATPGATEVARLVTGTAVEGGTSRSGFTQITVEGWVSLRSVERTNRAGFALVVSRAPEESLRTAPASGSALVARLLEGCLLTEVERRGDWVRVRRTGWAATGAVRAEGRPPPPADAAVPVEAAAYRRMVARRRVELRRAPDAPASAVLAAGAPLVVTGRSGDWVRVRTEGWVREDEIQPPAGSVLTGVTAAELRAAPEEYQGRLLRWTIQFIALRTADDLRPDFTPGQRYVLARGPAPEYAFVYVVVPADKVSAMAQVQPLTALAIVARVRRGRSTYLANPILELVEVESVARGEPSGAGGRSR